MTYIKKAFIKVNVILLENDHQNVASLQKAAVMINNDNDLSIKYPLKTFQCFENNKILSVSSSVPNGLT